jgi:hypothetical protein
MADERSIADLAGSNFQGRGAPEMADDETVVAHMEKAVVDRLDHPDQAERVQHACAAFIEAEYSLEQAAETYERLYADRTVRIDGPFRHVANPLQFIREIRGWRGRGLSRGTRMVR